MSTETEGIRQIHETVPSLEMRVVPEKGGYEYRFPDGNGVILSVPNGASSEKPVTIENGTGLLFIEVKRDGETALSASGGVYDQPGEYEVLLDSLTADETGETITSYEGTLRFSIGERYRSEQTVLRAPENMVIESVRLNGRLLLLEKNQESLELSGDGAYTAVYAGRKDPSIQYTEEFILDTKAPELFFSEDITASRIYAPVRIRCEDPEATVTLIRDGVEYPLTELGITNGGRYLVRAEDPAGNTTDYSFFVSYAKRGQGVLWLVLPAVLLLAAVFQVIYLRRHRLIK